MNFPEDQSESAKSGAEHYECQTLQLLYHELDPSPGGYTYAISPVEFARHLNLYRRLQTADAHVIRPAVTFDDGHISNYEYALPALASAGVQAQFFIPAGWTSQRASYMGWDHLRELKAAGHKIGAHSWSHALLTHCSVQDLQRELTDARHLLEDKLGVAVNTMSLPGGRSNPEVLQACTRAGYAQVYTSVPKAEREPLPSLVGRLNLRSDASAEWLERLLSSHDGTLGKLERQYRLKQAAQRALGDKLYGKIWTLLNRARPMAEPA